MKRTFTINISGYSFLIDDDAYQTLKNFIERFGSEHNSSPSDVKQMEKLIAKFMTEKYASTNQSITNEMVIEAINEIENNINELKTESSFSQSEGQNAHKSNNPNQPSGKKLYRDANSIILGGVCSGLANYFSIDKALVRVLFLALFFITAGTAAFLYIILWIAAPKNIHVQQKINEKLSENRNLTPNPKSKQSGENIIAKIFGVFFLIIGFSVLIFLISATLIATRTLGILPGFSDGLFFKHIFNENMGTSLFLALLIVFGIPVLLLIYAGTKLLFNYVTNSKSVFVTALVAWIVAWIVIIGSIKGAVVDFKYDSMVMNQESINIDPEIIFIKLNEHQLKKIESFKTEINNYKIAIIDDNERIVARPTFSIGQSEHENINLKIKKIAKGNNDKNAKRNADEIIISTNFNGDTLLIDPYFMLPVNEKWRYQRVNISLDIPLGKTLYFHENMVPLLQNISNQQNIWEPDMVGQYWKMENDGLTIFQP